MMFVNFLIHLLEQNSYHDVCYFYIHVHLFELNRKHLYYIWYFVNVQKFIIFF